MGLKILILEEGDDTPALILKTLVKFDNGDKDNGM